MKTLPLLLLPVLWITLLMMMVRTTIASSSAIIAKPNCADRCGNITVPYPFGIGDPSCAMNKPFQLDCYTTNNTLYFGNIPILNISLENGTITGNIDSSFDCYYLNNSTFNFNQSIDLRDWEVFTISPTHNKLTALGCDTLALMNDAEDRFGSGCISLCNNKSDVQIDASCSGFGCCQTPIPRNLQTLNITIGSVNNHTEVLDFNPCGYAFVAENSFNVSGINISDYPTDPYPSPPAALEWVIGEHSCQAGEGYSCSSNADCFYSETGRGYRCLCNQGFRGNPYLQEGCQDIDECKEPGYPCQGKCINISGNYTCKCPLGMSGDGKVGCNGVNIITITTAIGGAIFVVITIILISILFQRRRKEKYFKENGGLILKHQRIKIFSEAELVGVWFSVSNIAFSV